MSADNWAACPACVKRLDVAVGEAERAAEKAYGVVPVDEWMKLRDTVAAAQAKRDEPEQTLREDYEIGVSDGVFEVDYRAHCSKCQWSYAFKHDAIAERGL